MLPYHFFFLIIERAHYVYTYIALCYEQISTNFNAWNTLFKLLLITKLKITQICFKINVIDLHKRKFCDGHNIIVKLKTLYFSYLHTVIQFILNCMNIFYLFETSSLSRLKLFVNAHWLKNKLYHIFKANFWPKKKNFFY